MTDAPLACLQLIREGAFLVGQPEEVRHILGYSLNSMPADTTATAHLPPKARQRLRLPSHLNAAQPQVWQALGQDVEAIDTLRLHTGLTAADISSILVSMGLSGWVENRFGRYHRGVTAAPSARG